MSFYVKLWKLHHGNKNYILNFQTFDEKKRCQKFLWLILCKLTNATGGGETHKEKNI